MVGNDCVDDVLIGAVDLTSLENFRAEIGEDGFYLVGELIKLFLMGTPDKLAQLQTSLAQGEADRMMLVAHTLKAATALLGARRLSALCLQLEDIGRSGQLTHAAELVTQLITEYEQVKLILVRELKKISESQ